MPDIAADSTGDVPSDASQPQTHAQRARNMRVALDKVYLRPPNPGDELLTEHEVQQISYFYFILGHLLLNHLHRLHASIHRYTPDTLTMTQFVTNLDRHDEAQDHLYSIREITWILGVGPQWRRKYIVPKPVLEYPVQSWLSFLRVNVRTALSNFRLVEKDLIDADMRSTRTTTIHSAIAASKHQIIRIAFQLPELTELCRYIGMNNIEEFLTPASSAGDAQVPTTSLAEGKVPGKQEIPDDATCLICWAGCEEGPPIFLTSPMDSEPAPRPYPAIEETGIDSMIHAPCCKSAVYHKACLARAIRPPTPKCPHCQQAFHHKFSCALIQWQGEDFARKILILQELMIEEMNAISA